MRVVEGDGQRGWAAAVIQVAVGLRRPVMTHPEGCCRDPQGGALTYFQRSGLMLLDETIAKYSLAPRVNVDFHKFVYMRLQETSGCFFPLLLLEFPITLQ